MPVTPLPSVKGILGVDFSRVHFILGNGKGKGSPLTRFAGNRKIPVVARNEILA